MSSADAVTLARTDEERDRVERYRTLASAIAGRDVEVVESDTERIYTDGRAVHVPARGRVAGDPEGIAAQAALLAVGSLDRGVVKRLTGRANVRHRYLTLEAARAGRELEHGLPRRVCARIRELYEGDVPQSAEDSRRVARSDASVPEAPEWLGTLRPLSVLRTGPAPDGQPVTEASELRPANHLRELSDDEEPEESQFMKLLEAPMRNPIGRALQKLLGAGQAPDDGTGHGGEEMDVSAGERAGRRASGASAPSWLRVDLSATAENGRSYPEWDERRRRYQPDWCTVFEVANWSAGGAPQLEAGDDTRLRRELARLGLADERYRRQAEGDALDVTALIDFVVDVRTGVTPDPRVYETRLRTAHDLGVLVLLDSTGSTGDDTDGLPLFDRQRRLAADLTAALDALGDRVATYAFSSRGRASVRFQSVKDFDERYTRTSRRRLAALEPSGFTRLGAAVRHATHLLTTRAGTQSTLLVLIGDGLPYDHDGYESRYAEADVRRALQEAVTRGVGCACLSVGSTTDAEVIERVWHPVPYRSLDDPEEFPLHARALFGQALQEAAASRRRIDRRDDAP